MVSICKKMCLLPLILLAGCATPAPSHRHEALNWLRPQKRIVLLPPDIRMALRNADETLEFLPERSHMAQNIHAELMEQEFSTKGIAVAKLKAEDTPLADQAARLQAELIAGNDAPGTRANIRRYTTLKDTLGSGLSPWADQYGVDYAAILYIRDIETSTGKILANATTSALLTVLSLGRVQHQISDAHRISCLSLIDLYTGDTVWNRCQKDTDGAITNTTDAKEQLQSLMQDMPQ